MENFEEKELYPIHHVGSFGRFYSGKSFPIEFVQTGFSAVDLMELEFARDVRPETLDFNLLMQRDIDEERVKKKMAPYLNPDVSSAEAKSRALFFPPLLVAVIPTDGTKMLPFYSDEELHPPAPSGQTGDNMVVREWPGFFKLSLFKANGPDAYLITDKDGKEWPIKREPARISIRKAMGHVKGSKLIVIDGQHRLSALRQVYINNPGLIEDLVVPVCLIFAPNCTRQKEIEYQDIKIPKVSEVFRNLFVDINTTMELVGGHFNILLSDSNIGQLTCRRFCNYVLNEFDQKGLALIEWNTKSKKDSTIIKRPYSITSIGVLDKALEENFGKRRRQKLSLLKYIAGIQDVEAEKDEDEDIEIDVEWERFSLSQKNIIEEKLDHNIVRAFGKIFFESDFFAPIYSIFTAEITRLEQIEKQGGQTASSANLILRQCLDYIPIPTDSAYASVRHDYAQFLVKIEAEIKLKVSPMINYAIFQRGLINSWLELIEMLEKYSVDLLTATDCFLRLLNKASRNKGELFSSSNRFMQYSVFSRTTIKPKNDTRDAIANLIISILGNIANTNYLLEELGALGADKKKALQARFFDAGQVAASRFMEHYKKERKADFISSYKVDFDSLTPEERERLAEFQDEYEQHKKEVRAGQRHKDQVSMKFFESVDKFVSKDVSEAARALQEALGYDVDILDNSDDQDFSKNNDQDNES